MNKYKRIAILLMAGNSNRFSQSQKIKKQFLEINGKPIFVYPFNSLVSSGLFDQIILVCPVSSEKQVSDIIHGMNISKNISIIKGGESRNDSVLSALRYIESNFKDRIDEKTFVLIHDAARPFLPISILKVIDSLCDDYDAIAPAIPLTDSIMQKGVYVSRENIQRIQTPQAFRLFKLISIYDSAMDNQSTDDFSKAIQAGLTNKVIKGSPLLYKITFPEDIEFFERVLN